jgi:hypothetical protein
MEPRKRTHLVNELMQIAQGCFSDPYVQGNIQ